MTRFLGASCGCWGVLVAVLLGACGDDSGGTGAGDGGVDRPADTIAEIADTSGAESSPDVVAEAGDGAGDRGGDLAGDAAEVAPGCGCAADELCVQLNDGVCQGTPTRVVCRKVSEGCRAESSKIVAVTGSCYMVSAACKLEYCPQPYQCDNTAPCGNETASARVWCYGP